MDSPSSLNLVDFEQELSRVLGGMPNFIDCEIIGNKVVIHIGGSLSLPEKQDIADTILSSNCLSDLGDWQVEVFDDGDRLKISDDKRRNLERKIQQEIARLRDIDINDIDRVRLRFSLWSRLVRGMGFNAQGTVLKVDADPDNVAGVRAILLSLAEKYGLPLKVRGTTLFGAARDEVRIERARHVKS